MPTLAPETLLIGLAWTVLALALQLLLLIGLGGWVQVRRRKANLLRIECHKRWEGAAAEFLFGEDQDPARFGPLGEPEKRLFRPFLVRILSALSGKEAALIRDL